MRTTLTIEDDVIAAAKALAEARGVSVGKAVSELARRGLQAAPQHAQVNGFAVFDAPADAPMFGPEAIRAAEDADDVQRYGSAFER
jgi:hypothetical protein